MVEQAASQRHRIARTVRPTWAEIDLSAIDHNVRILRDLVAPSEVCAVVKAFAYGHGIVRVAETALNAGATRLAVALVEEGRELRRAGIEEPIFVLSQAPSNALKEVVEFDLTPTVYSVEAVDELAEAANGAAIQVHMKVDTGMHRVGASPLEVLDIARTVAKYPNLNLQGAFTHFAVADEPKNKYTNSQLEQFSTVLSNLNAEGFYPALIHASNSAAAIAFPRARFDFVRCGISVYGIEPAPGLGADLGLQPAMSLKSQISFVKKVPANTAVSYGLNYRTKSDTTLATIPIGYADGVPRRLGLVGGEVLIGGKRRQLAGVVTMDQIIVDCGVDDVAVGDEVVLLGRQGDEQISAWDWATRLDDSAYAIVCGISARVPRRYV